jgi:hypothetical protein
MLLSTKAIKICLPFPNTYLCEARFSSHTQLYTALHRLSVEVWAASIQSYNKRDAKRKTLTFPFCFCLENIFNKILFMLTCKWISYCSSNIYITLQMTRYDGRGL